MRCARWSARRGEKTKRRGRADEKTLSKGEKHGRRGGSAAQNGRTERVRRAGRLCAAAGWEHGGLPAGARGGTGGGRGDRQAHPADKRREGLLRGREGRAGAGAVFARCAGGKRAERDQRVFGLLSRLAAHLRARGGRDRAGRGGTGDRGGAVRGRFAGGGARGRQPAGFLSQRTGCVRAQRAARVSGAAALYAVSTRGGTSLWRVDAPLDALSDGTAHQDLRRDGEKLGALRQCALCGDL